MDADTERELDEAQRRTLEDAGPIESAQHFPEEGNAQKIRELQIALLKLAFSCAARYDGPGSGPTQPHFWLVQVLGEDYDRSILDLWQPEPSIPVVTQECGVCHEEFQVPVDTANRTISVSQKPICPSCEPKTHNS